jgi:hypothetical protein
VNPATTAALLDDLTRLRLVWVRALEPVIGRRDAVLLIDTVELLVPVNRRLDFAMRVAFHEHLQGEARVVEVAVREKARKTVALLLAEPDEAAIDALVTVLPRATFDRMLKIAAKLRDAERADVQAKAQP